MCSRNSDGYSIHLEGPQMPVAEFKAFLENYNNGDDEIIDLDQFYLDIEDIDTLNLADRIDNNHELLNNFESYKNSDNTEVNIRNNSVNCANNTSASTNIQHISISSNEDTVLKDFQSLEDDIPLSVLVKNRSLHLPQVLNLDKLYSNITKTVQIIPCDQANHKMTNDDSVDMLENIKLINNADVNIELHDSDNGYHSSDFEFITESEAKKAGLFISKNQKRRKRKTQIHNFDNVERVNSLDTYDYRTNHFIPEGEDFLDLFKDLHAPTTSVYTERKDFNVSRMSIDYKGIGFNMNLHAKSRDDEECLEETKRVTKMIYRLYPDENRKRRRRLSIKDI